MKSVASDGMMSIPSGSDVEISDMPTQSDDFVGTFLHLKGGYLSKNYKSAPLLNFCFKIP
jgi:hypothetical protein